jgi:hypothetical protein
MRRVAGALAVVLGLTLVTFTFVEHLFTRARDAQTIADHYEPLMSRRGLHDLSTGFETLQAAGTQLHGSAEPRLQRALGIDDRQFDAYLARQMPGIHGFDRQAPGVVALVGPVITKMQAERADYARASAIPTSWLPLSSAPWLFLGIGLLSIGAGLYALVRPDRAAAVALLVVGTGLAVAPLAVGIPSKVDAAIRVTELGRVGLAPQTGARAVAATKLFDGMVADVRGPLEVALQERAGVESFPASYPTLAGFADAWQRSTSAKSHALSDSQVALAGTFANADRIPLRPIPWLFIVPGVALAAVSGASLVAARRRDVGAARSAPDPGVTVARADSV